MALAGRLGELEGALRDRGQALQRALAARAGDLRELFDTRGEHLVEALSARGSQIAQELTGLGEIVTQTIEGRGTAMAQHLGEKQSELTAAIEHSIGAFARGDRNRRRSVDWSPRRYGCKIAGRDDRGGRSSRQQQRGIATGD